MLESSWPEMRPHHRRAMERVVARFRDDERFLALLLGGSVVRGLAVETSDIDILLVATDEEYARRQQTDEFSYYDTEDCDYPGGYVDGKILNLAFLREAADHGSEPTRASFAGVLVGFSRLPELPDLLARIPVYQEAERAEKIPAFYGQIQLAARYFIPEAEKRHDPYLLTLPTAKAGGFLLHGSLPETGEPVPVLQPLHRLTPLVQRPKRSSRRSRRDHGRSHIPDTSTV